MLYYYFCLVRQCPEVNLNGIIRNYALEYKALPGGSPQTDIEKITQRNTATLTTVQLLSVQRKRFSSIFCKKIHDFHTLPPPSHPLLY